jgi:hypothetical protein
MSTLLLQLGLSSLRCKRSPQIGRVRLPVPGRVRLPVRLLWKAVLPVMPAQRPGGVQRRRGLRQLQLHSGSRSEHRARGLRLPYWQRLG